VEGAGAVTEVQPSNNNNVEKETEAVDQPNFLVLERKNCESFATVQLAVAETPVCHKQEEDDDGTPRDIHPDGEEQSVSSLEGDHDDCQALLSSGDDLSSEDTAGNSNNNNGGGDAKAKQSGQKAKKKKAGGVVQPKRSRRKASRKKPHVVDVVVAPDAPPETEPGVLPPLLLSREGEASATAAKSSSVHGAKQIKPALATVVVRHSTKQQTNVNDEKNNNNNNEGPDNKEGDKVRAVVLKRCILTITTQSRAQMGSSPCSMLLC